MFVTTGLFAVFRVQLWGVGGISWGGGLCPVMLVVCLIEPTSSMVWTGP